MLWLRIAVVGAVILGSAYLAPRASLHQVILLAGALFGVGGLLALIGFPSLGLLALVVCCLIVPFSIGTGTESPINAGVLCLIFLVGLWVLDMAWRPEARLRFSRPIPPLLALAGVATLSFALGIQPEAPFAQTAPLRAQLGGLAIFWLTAAAFLLAAHQIRDLRWLEGLTWLFVALGATYVAGQFVGTLGGLTNRVFQTGADSLFFIWLVALSFSQAAFNRRLGLPWRVLLAGVVLATLYQGFFRNRDWNSGWVPPLVSIFAILWFATPRRALPLTVLGGAVALMKLSTITGYLHTSKEYDILTRTAAWDTLISVIKINPVLGLGPANYYWYTPLFSILGYNVKFNSHNNYMDLILQTGFVGLICFIWLALEIGWLGIRLRGRVAPGFGQAYVYGALGGLVGMLASGMMGDWFLPFVYNIGLTGFRASVLGWVFLGGLLVIERLTRAVPVSGGSRSGVQASG